MAMALPLQTVKTLEKYIRQQAQAHGASMLLAPTVQEWDVGLWRMPGVPRPEPDEVLPWFPYREAAATWAGQKGVGVVDLPAAFAAAPGDPQALFIDNMHPSRMGAKVMAQALAAHVRARPELLGL